jgi:LacI family transcriptional regulator
MKRASLKSIAVAAGVSKTTASFVLNGKGDHHKINTATQQRILDEARQQNYQPSFLAQTLSSGKTMSIGLLLPNTANNFVCHLLHHLVTHFQSQNYRLLPGMAQLPAVGERDIIDDFILRQTDAIIAVQPLHEKEWASSLALLQIPLVLINNEDGGVSPGTLNHDYVQMVNLLIQHHFQHHKKAIGFIGRERTSHPKLEAYRTCYIDRFDISSSYHYLLKTSEPVANALKALALQSVNAIVFESPDMAQQALQYLQSNHLSNMEGMDFSCIGWDRDLTFAQPKVHGVDYAPSQLAAKVSQILNAALKNPRDASHAPNETLYQLFPEKH